MSSASVSRFFFSPSLHVRDDEAIKKWSSFSGGNLRYLFFRRISKFCTFLSKWRVTNLLLGGVIGRSASPYAWWMKLMKIQVLEYTCLFVIRMHIKSRLPAKPLATVHFCVQRIWIQNFVFRRRFYCIVMQFARLKNSSILFLVCAQQTKTLS